MKNALVIIDEKEVGGDRIPTVDARELWEFLGVRTQFSHWIVDRLADFVEGSDYIVFSENALKTNQGRPDGRGRPMQQYALTLGAAKHIALMERNDKGKEIRQYFIDAEKENRDNREERLIEKVIAKALPAPREDDQAPLEDLVLEAFGETTARHIFSRTTLLQQAGAVQSKLYMMIYGEVPKTVPAPPGRVYKRQNLCSRKCFEGVTRVDGKVITHVVKSGPTKGEYKNMSEFFFKSMFAYDKD